MISRSGWAIVLLLILVSAATRTATAATPAATELPVTRMVGQRLANFRLEDVTSGKKVSLYGFRGKRAVVLAFVGTECPLANVNAPRLVELSREFRDKGVVFLGINSNAHETSAQIAAHAKEHGITFPVLRDEGNVVADSALVERTGEVIVLDGMGLIRYRGAVDDQYAIGKRKPAAEHHYLKDAIESVVTGGRVDVKATPAPGCLLDRLEPKAAKAVASTAGVSRVRPAAPEIARALRPGDESEVTKVGPVSYADEVAAIVQNKCQNCHRPGEVGPFPLLTYDDARKHAAMIREVVDERRMPPWHADPRYGHFKNDRSLTSRDRATLMAWVDQGAPLGDPKSLPAARSYPEGWTIGTPDVVFEIPEPFTVPAQGTVEYVHIRVPSKFTKDMWVQAAEARPGDRSVVHHIIVYVDDKAFFGDRRKKRADAHLCGYAPGDMPSVYPDGSGKKIPAGSDLIFQIHYTPTGKVRTDRSKVGLIFAKGPVKHRAHTLGIAEPKFEIPPGAGDYPVDSTFTFENDAHLLSLLPHMHLRGKSFRFEATFPDGRKQVLLSVPAFDFGWQTYYTLAEPRAMPKGTRIDCFARFDNSPGNPYNPDPSKTVRWGEQTWDEMMIGYVDYIDDAPPEAEAAAAQSAGVKDKAASVLQTFRALGRRAPRPAFSESNAGGKPKEGPNAR